MRKQEGWTGLGALAVLLSAAMGGLAMHFFLLSADQNSPPSIQWGILTVFLLPLGFATQLWWNLNSLRELKGVTESERRRLRETVSGKRRQIGIAICFYICSAFAIAIGLFLSTGNWLIYSIATIYTGVALAISICSFFLILNEIRELSDFKSKVHERAIKVKSINKKLEKMSAKATKK